MSIPFEGHPAIALVDDDFYSARMLTRVVEAQGGPTPQWLSDPDEAAGTLIETSRKASACKDTLVVVDLKSSSVATRTFLERLKASAPGLLVVAMAPSLDRETRQSLLASGAAAVFERHAEATAYRTEIAALMDFWARHQGLHRAAP
ncbi:MAG: hypothetical protein ABL879_10560 [Devosia sp.]